MGRDERTGADAPKTRAELYEIGSNATCQGAPRWDDELARKLGEK